VADLAARIATECKSIRTVIAGLPSTAQTLTNKRITPRVNTQTTVTGGTLTPDSDSYDAYAVTGQTVPLTIANPTGTPTSFQALRLFIRDDGTARALTWGTAYKAMAVALPTTTVAGKELYVGLYWRPVTSKWDAVAITQEA
jgi:hypothetical protein